MGAYLDLTARPVLTAADATALRAGTEAQLAPGQQAQLTAAGGSFRRTYTWDAASVAADDGVNVIKPNSIGGGSPGRWLILGDTAASFNTYALRDASGNIAAVGLIVTSLFVTNIDAPTPGPNPLNIGTQASTGAITIGRTGQTVTIPGNLVVSGTTTTVNSTTVNVADRIVAVNFSSGANDPVPVAITGLSVHRGAVAGVTRDRAAWLWDESVSRWKAALNTGGDDTTLGALLGIEALEFRGATVNTGAAVDLALQRNNTTIANVTATGFNFPTVPGVIDVTTGALTLRSNTASLIFETAVGAGTAQALWRGASSALARTDTFNPTGACSITWASTVTSASIAHSQHGSGAGVGMTIRAQQGFAGFAGGDLTLASGLGGTPGTNLSGNVLIELGQVVSSASAFLRILSNGSIVGVHQLASGPVYRIGSGALATAGLLLETIGGGAMTLRASTSLDLTSAATAGTPTFNWRGNTSSIARVDSLPHAGANTMRWSASVTSITLDQSTQTSDVACANITIRTQAPFASATGTNRTPGTLVLSVPAAVGGGTEGKLSLEVGGSEVLNLSKATSSRTTWTAAQTNDLEVIFTDTAINGTNGHFVSITAQHATGTATTGGEARLQGGNGTTIGGNALVAGGAGITDGGGGHALVRGGAKAGTGIDGNVAFHALPASWAAASRIIFVGNAAVTPSDVPTAGGYLYADAGAGKWRGPSGTITTFGAADPHCPTCGRDFALEWENTRHGERLAVCVPCMIDGLEGAGISPVNYAFVRELHACA